MVRWLDISSDAFEARGSQNHSVCLTKLQELLCTSQLHKCTKQEKQEFCCWSKKSLCLLLNPVFPDARSLLVTYREDKIGPSSPRAYSTVSPASRDWQHRHMHISSRPASLLHLVSPNACFFCPSRWKPCDLEAAGSSRNQTHTHKLSEPSKELCIPSLPTPKLSNPAENREARGLPSHLP